LCVIWWAGGGERAGDQFSHWVTEGRVWISPD